MALKITDHCINCGYCAKECPNEAIYEPGMKWAMDEGTALKGLVTMFDGKVVDAHDTLPPLSDKYYFIIPEKCAECKGMYSQPQCLEVCPDPDSLIVHPGFRETLDDLLTKQALLN